MGNVLPLPCMCEEASVVHATAAGDRKTDRVKRPAVAKNAFVSPEQHGGGDEEVMKKRAAWPGCRVQELAGEEYGVRLNVLMTRKEAAEFMARLEERKARMGKLGGGNSVASPCPGVWRPRLATIPEN